MEDESVKQIKWLKKIHTNLVSLSKTADQDVYGTYIGIRVHDLIDSVEQSMRDVRLEAED